MREILLPALLWFFALYGVIQMVKSVSDAAGRQSQGFFIVISVKNQQEHIEDIIRTTVWRSLHRLGGREVPQIYVVDFGSADDTLKILSRLCEEYDFVTVLSREEYISLMEKV